ncbi:DUF742 domain-containing protein [Amycolatopsis sp. A133]|uniref:DUF742 domain-containing protein n=1 Tax=Amycolatopsis sp. A133 TaxID=3064472 RepID=UPI0027EF7F20|nr:DUF742 domain-containing protein [Amycolatopsis sp. A133]MDQ7810898.1 DUF742 domain-containing protein [Amycolatopsis sp. A133]
MTGEDRAVAAAAAGRSPGRLPAAGEPVRFGGWSDYGEWADHDFRDRGASDEPGAGGKRPIVVEVMTAVVPIHLPEEPAEEFEIREVCRISPPGEDGAEADFTLEVDPSALVRPYLGAGRPAKAGADLGLETMIETVQPYATLPLKSLSADQRRVYRTCAVPQSVAEIAVAIGAPIDLTQLIIGEGIERGFLRVHSTAPPTVDGLPSLELLRRVHRGLSRLS